MFYFTKCTPFRTLVEANTLIKAPELKRLRTKRLIRTRRKKKFLPQKEDHLLCLNLSLNSVSFLSLFSFKICKNRDFAVRRTQKKKLPTDSDRPWMAADYMNQLKII